MVELSAKAHYVAHHLLHLAFPENKKLAAAFGMMVKGKDKRQFTAKMYEDARKAISFAQKGRKRPDLSEINRQRRKPPKPKPPRKPFAIIAYNQRKKLEGFTSDDIENKRKAGRARKGVVMSDEGRASYSRAAIKRQMNAPLISCSKCGHQQKRSPNFYRFHESNCSYQ